MSGLRRLMATLATTMFLVGCTSTPEPAPTDGTGDGTPSAAPSPAASPGNAEVPLPSPAPTREITVGGTLSASIAGVTAEFVGIQCDVASGLAVIAQGEGLAALALTVDEDGDVAHVVFTADDGSTGLVGNFVGRATYEGDPSRFRIDADASWLAAGAAGPAEQQALTITGACG